ncbi:bifunctional phosphoribosylaminoimidazolecarboxamide formyltransferase/IMP cyclohydrolase [Blattabacterium cuenoti]|uniref:bifunctional phosphoribosylaminoimidazolecarboxamide formyltransferase/IMP cyclohydrolase n=1 Tax=Blattabacterium cuenoti TaxID=1653831 RepID=UPI00163C6C80|nr:bifunctional phosphoribosylaminoimidazolecarboxamide formyltransferase/IMP cyclohydrolase [Blattabacterium cuenoti]
MKRALVSVYEKNEKLLDFVHFLCEKKYQIISTGGTFKYLKNNGISKIKNLSNIISFSDFLDGRIKTIHPNVYGGILANRSLKKHMEYLSIHQIDTIDIVLVNFYPFFEKSKQYKNDSLIEFIDIGGPSMLRAAAKNFLYVTPITDQEDYFVIKKEIEKYGYPSLRLRKKLAGKVFNFTSAYDSAISQFFLKDDSFPTYLHLSYEKKMNLRYGENPHQKAAYYISKIHKGSMIDFHQFHGKELSFNNLRDMDIAWKIVDQFSEPACCIVKHATPCGVSLGKDIMDSFKKTYESDPISSFGGIIAFNILITKELAEKINNLFFEVILSSNYDHEVLNILKKKKNLRIIKIINNSSNYYDKDKLEYVKVDGGILVQQIDDSMSFDYKIVTKKKFSDQEIKSFFFAQRVVKYVKSNAIVVVKGTQTIGISGGQTNRIFAARQAIDRALEKRKKNLVLVSDAFFPFRDVVDVAAGSGIIKAIFQPGGSIRDEESVKACNEHGIAMAFTGRRYFKH